MIEPGTQAPDFTLPDQDGIDLSLADFAGRRVCLVFYPMDFSPACSDQLSVYQEVLPELERKGVTMLGINVDHSFSHKAFQERVGNGIRLLADFHPKAEVCRAYGALIESRGHPGRSLVLIDPDGVVEWVHEAPSPTEIPGAHLIFDALDRAG